MYVHVHVNPAHIPLPKNLAPVPWELLWKGVDLVYRMRNRENKQVLARQTIYYVFLSKEGSQGGPACCQHLWTSKADYQSCFTGIQGMSQDLNFSFLGWKMRSFKMRLWQFLGFYEFWIISARWQWTEVLPYKTFLKHKAPLIIQW